MNFDHKRAWNSIIIIQLFDENDKAAQQGSIHQNERRTSFIVNNIKKSSHQLKSIQLLQTETLAIKEEEEEVNTAM